MKSSSIALSTMTAVVALVLWGCGDGDAAAQTGAATPPPAQVTVVTLAREDVALTAELPGRTVAPRTAQVRPQISGIIEARLFEEGGEVQQGQQLYQIDAARYNAALITAEANLRRAQAGLASRQAQFQRIQDLLKQKAVSQQQFDEAKAAFEETQAEVAVAEAAVTTAKIEMQYTQVSAPIAGRIGISNVTEGALVSAQQAQIMATIHQLDPIYVDLAQSAGAMLELRRQLLDGRLALSADAQVELTLEDGSVYEHLGSLRTAEMSVDESTGTVALRAEFPNPDHLLLPGMFVRARVQEAVRENALLVPQRGVTRDRQGQATALVVNDQNQVEQRTLQTERAVGDRWLVGTGLETGDRVIVEGLQKVAPGAQVNAVEAGPAVSRVER